MGRFIDLTNKTFYRLKVVQRSNKKTNNKAIYWQCECKCGNITTVRGDSLKNGDIKSCGCFHKERKTTHGLSKQVSSKEKILYEKWKNMKNRCYNKKTHNYKSYGGRGIKIYKEWLDDPKSFVEYCINKGFEIGLEIDRIDNDKSYEPNNITFSNKSKNCSNRQNKSKYGTYVYYRPKENKSGPFKVQARMHGSIVCFGYYKTLEDANKITQKIKEIKWKNK